MEIYEDSFNQPNDKDPRYSAYEVDYYGYIPPNSGEDNHGLAIRKNLESGKYEVVAHYWRSIRRPDFKTVLFEGNLCEAAFFADNLCYKFHNSRHYDKIYGCRVITGVR